MSEKVTNKQNRISRREFLKRMAVVAGGVFGWSLLSGTQRREVWATPPEVEEQYPELEEAFSDPERFFKLIETKLLSHPEILSQANGLGLSFVFMFGRDRERLEAVGKQLGGDIGKRITELVTYQEKSQEDNAVFYREKLFGGYRVIAKQLLELRERVTKLGLAKGAEQFEHWRSETTEIPFAKLAQVWLPIEKLHQAFSQDDSGEWLNALSQAYMPLVTLSYWFSGYEGAGPEQNDMARQKSRKHKLELLKKDNSREKLAEKLEKIWLPLIKEWRLDPDSPDARSPKMKELLLDIWTEFFGELPLSTFTPGDVPEMTEGYRSYFSASVSANTRENVFRQYGRGIFISRNEFQAILDIQIGLGIARAHNNTQMIAYLEEYMRIHVEKLVSSLAHEFGHNYDPARTGTEPWELTDIQDFLSYNQNYIELYEKLYAQTGTFHPSDIEMWNQVELIAGLGEDEVGSTVNLERLRDEITLIREFIHALKNTQGSYGSDWKGNVTAAGMAHFFIDNKQDFSVWQEELLDENKNGDFVPFPAFKVLQRGIDIGGKHHAINTFNKINENHLAELESMISELAALPHQYQLGQEAEVKYLLMKVKNLYLLASSVLYSRLIRLDKIPKGSLLSEYGDKIKRKFDWHVMHAMAGRYDYLPPVDRSVFHERQMITDMGKQFVHDMSRNVVSWWDKLGYQYDKDSAQKIENLTELLFESAGKIESARMVLWQGNEYSYRNIVLSILKRFDITEIAEG